MSGSIPSGKAKRPYAVTGTHTDTTSINAETAIVMKDAVGAKGQKKKTFIEKKPQKVLCGPGYQNDKESYQRYMRDNNILGFTEVLAGEWQRLMREGQPKTRLRVVTENNEPKIKVLSERLTDFVSLDTIARSPTGIFYGENGKAIMNKVCSGEIPGLGDCAMGLLTTLNGDGHLGNVGVAKNSKGELGIYVIDAGLCYWPLHYQYVPERGVVNTKSQVVPLEERDIQYFPFLTNSSLINNNLHNFLDVVYRGKLNIKISVQGPVLGSVFPIDLKYNPQFLAEKHARMLKEIVMPNHVVLEFMMKYAIPDYAISASQEDLRKRAEECARVHNERKNSLRKVALQDPGFCAYLQTQEASDVLSAHIERLGEFVVHGKEKLLTRDVRWDVKKAVMKEKNNLCDEAQNFLSHQGMTGGSKVACPVQTTSYPPSLDMPATTATQRPPTGKPPRPPTGKPPRA